jgi:peptidoglycan/LPS O-acetylase OafA/YrhL
VLIALACRNKGAWEWLASHRRNLSLAFLLLGCGVVVLLKYQKYLYIVGLTWIGAFYASLLLLTLVNPGRIGTSLFRSQVLIKLGTVAYAVYIFHQGINALFHFAIFGRGPSINSWSSLSVTVLSLITVILLAALSWKTFEKPLIRHAHAAYRY